MEGKQYFIFHKMLSQEGTQFVPYIEGNALYTNKLINTSQQSTTSNLYTILGGSGWTQYADDSNPTRSYIIAQELHKQCKEQYGLSDADVKIFELAKA